MRRLLWLVTWWAGALLLHALTIAQQRLDGWRYAPHNPAAAA